MSTATPVTSFERRVFLILIPLFSILLAKLVNFMISIRYAKYVIVPLIILLTFTPLKSPLIENLRKDLEPYGMHNIIQGDLESDAGWVKNIIVFFYEKRIPKEDLVLTTKEQLPLLYYLNNKVHLIWAVKKKFIDDYEENLWIIENKNEDDLKKHCEVYSLYTKDYDRCKNFNYIEKIKNCKKYSLKNNISIYYCEKKSNKQ